MTRVRAVVAWLVLVPAGSVLLGFGLMAAVPGAVLIVLGLLLWTCADRLLRRTAPTADDELWRSYLSHPSATEQARRRVRGDRP